MRAKGMLAVLVAVGLGGWAAVGWAAGSDCRDCHGALERAAGAADFSSYYANRVRHHPVGRVQPGADNPAYRQADARSEEMPFFDSNGNGSLDAEEPRLSASGTVECFSCHREHGGGEPMAMPAAAYVRGSNANSALCVICHRN